MVILYLFYDLFYGKGASWEKGYIFAVYLLAVERALHIPPMLLLKKERQGEKLHKNVNIPLTNGKDGIIIKNDSQKALGVMHSQRFFWYRGNGAQMGKEQINGEYQ